MMLRQGVTKRGDAINVASTSTYASHHAEVHSILKNRHIHVQAIAPAPEGARRSKSASRREAGGLSSSLTRTRSKSRSSRKLGGKPKGKRSHSQPAVDHGESKRSAKLKQQSDDEDERCLLDGSSDEYDISPTHHSDHRKNNVRSKSERVRNDSRAPRGRDIGARQQSEPTQLPITKPPTRGTSLNRYSNFLRRGRSASARGRQQQQNQFIRSLSPNRFLYSQQQESANDDARRDIPYDAIVVRENSFESHESSLTGDHEYHSKPRSKSLIRSAIRHLGISKKNPVSQELDNDNTHVTESTLNTSCDISNTSSSAAPAQWDPKKSLLQQGGQLEIIDSDSEEDQSCATRSDEGLNDSNNKLDMEEAHDTLKYDQVFHSSEHPMFRKTMDCDEESENISNTSPPKEPKPRQLMASIGKAIGRGRSLSVSRRKFTKGQEADTVAARPPMQTQHSKSSNRQLQKKPVKQHSMSKQSKIRAASVNTQNRLKASASNRSKSSRSISVSRMSKKKFATGSDGQKAEFLPDAVKPRKKKVKCIVCRQRLSKGQCVEHMDLYFCSGLDGHGSCFQCAKCRCALDQLPSGDVRVCNAQVLTNNRGSVVQCGDCAKVMFEPVAPEVIEQQIEANEPEPLKDQVEVDPVDKMHPFVLEMPRPKVCASCKGDFSQYTGEIQVLGEHNYHSACLKRESLKQSGQSAGSQYSPSTSFSDEDTPADAAQKLSEKVVVKLSVEDDNNYQREYLSATFFEWSNKQESLAMIKENEQSKRMEQFLKNNDSTVDLSLEILYELDASAFGNPNYSGNFSSHLSGDHKYSPRKTSVAFPIGVEVDEDGRICTDLVAELQWIGRPSPLSLEHVSSNLTIEPYPYEDSPVRKLMNQLWRYDFSGVYHEFQFTVPFKSEVLSLEINEGDEIDLADCRFDVFLDQVEHQNIKLPDQDPMKPTNSQRGSALTTSLTSNPSEGWESRADQLMHEVDNFGDLERSRVVSKSLPPRKRRSSNSVPHLSHCQHEHHTRLDPDGDEITNVSELLSVARSGEEHHAVSLPKVIHIKARKESSDDDTGLYLIHSNGSSVVAEVSKSGLFSSKLKEGAVVLAINGCPVRNPRHFMRLFKDADSKVTIMASNEPAIPGSIFSVVRKEKDSLPDIELLKSNPQDTTDTLGISFEMINDLVRVREVDPHGIFGNSMISQGDICLMVDGVPATNLNSAVRSLAFARGAISLLTFPLHNLWSNLMELMIGEEYNRNWRGSACELTAQSGYPINIHFDSISGLCFEETPGTESIKSDLCHMNTIIERVMDMLVQSIKICREPSDTRGSIGSNTRTRSLSVSANGSMKGRSDVYRRALIKLEEMKATGKLSKKDYNDAKHALMNVAIQK